MDNQNNTPQEIDIVQFFSAIGKMFKNIFTGIKYFFLQIFYLFLDLLLLVKKYYLYFGLAVIAGLILSFALQKNKKIYKATVTLRTNFDAQVPLQEKVDLLNSLIRKKKFIELANELQAETTTVKHFTYFDMTPVFNDVYMIEDYEEYLMSMDTVVYKFIEFEDYKKNIRGDKNLNNYWKIEAKADSPEVFNVLNKGIKDLLRNNIDLQQKEADYLAQLQFTKEKTRRSIQEIDTLRMVLNKAMLSVSNDKTSGLVVNSEKLRGPEGPYNLFFERSRLLTKMEIITKKIGKYSHPLVFISNFPTYGTLQDTIVTNRHLLYPLFGFLLVLSIILLIRFNKYLNAYQKRISNK